MFTLCLVAAVAPGGALVLAVLFGILARTVERSGSGLERRRMELGRSRTDVAVTVAALPWRLLMAVLTSIVAAILPLLVAASAAFVAGSMTGPDGTPQPTRALPLMIGMAAGLATAWWGPGGAKLRAGTRTIARSVTATHTGQVVVLVGCALVALAVLMVAVQSGSSPDWSPFQPPGALTR
jgi:choline-glycine betaine transporter